MDTRCSRGFTPIIITAALSVAILIAVSGMQLGKTFAQPAPIDPSTLEPVARRDYLAIEDSDKNGTPDWQDELMRTGVIATTSASSTASATSSDPLSGIGQALTNSLISGYLSLTQYNAYTPERGQRLGSALAENLHAPEIFIPHTVSELTLGPTASEDRAIHYRADMRAALEPLISAEEYELTLFAAYIETGDSTWLDRLTAAAKRYRAAEEKLLKVDVPQDAAPEHLRLTNALGAFAATLDRMARFAKDPLASIALLTTYNDEERDLDLAFDALVKYYARTIGDN